MHRRCPRDLAQHAKTDEVDVGSQPVGDAVAGQHIDGALQRRLQRGGVVTAAQLEADIPED